MKIVKVQFPIILIAAVITFAAMYSVKFFRQSSQPNFYEQFYLSGYDFRKYQNSDKDFARYQAELTIDTRKLKFNAADRSLKYSIYGPTLLVVVDPECPFVQTSSDISTRLREATSEHGLEYYPVVFNRGKFNVSKYAESIGFTDILVWEDESSAPDLLKTMPTPSHLLIDKHGRTLQVWFSSSRDESVRQRMAEQIVIDLLLIRDIMTRTRD